MEDRKEILVETQVKEVINQSYPAVSPSDLVTRAREVVRSTGFQSLPVTKNDKLEGIVTSRDLLQITSTRSNIPVKGLMSPPIIVGNSDWSLAKLARKTIQADINLVPVTRDSNDKSLLGVVSLENVLEKLSEAHNEAPAAESLMSEKVVTCNQNDSLSKVWNIMGETNYSGIPVTKKNKVIGMVARSDIIKSGKVRLAIESEGGRTPPKVKTVMETPPIKIEPNDSINKAIKLMTKREIGRLPVTKNKELIGIIDREDVIKPYL